MLKHPLFKFFASLKLAVVSLLALAGILAAATVLESLYGMRGAHVLVYGTWWFGGVLFILGVNVLCAALSRYPWKKSQTGFVVTHLGIITILVGSFMTQRWGVDGNLPVVEGQSDGQVLLNDLVLSLSPGEGAKFEVPLTEAATRRTGKLLEIQLSPEESLVVEEYLPRARTERRLVASPLAGIGAPALQVELSNSRFRLHEWLVARHPDAPSELNLGPATLYFRRLWNERDEATFRAAAASKPKSASKHGYLIAEYKGKQFRLDIADAMKGWKRLGSSSLEVKVDKYLPYAVVENNELVSKNNDPVNPAVQLLVRDALGSQERHTIFAHFPEFATLHRAGKKPDQKPFDVRFQMKGAGEAPGREDGQGRGELHFAQTADGKRLLYFVRGKSGELKGQGEVKPGEPVATGWMDLSFTVKQWLPAAVEGTDVRYIEYISGGDSQYLNGIRARVRSKRQTAAADESFWLVEGEVKSVAAAGRDYYLQLGKRRLELPFQIQLDKFQIGTDPGTTRAASYESRVTVKDPANAKAPSALISMNEPLDYGGYTFYQASYQMEEGRAPLSVFSVNYDPGRPVKYLGSLIMCLGIIIMFWFNPHYFGKIVGRNPKEVAP